MDVLRNPVRGVFGWLSFALLVANPSLPVSAAQLSVGDIAPEFELLGSDGITYRLSELIQNGDQGVVLAWFPKAFTRG